MAFGRFWGNCAICAQQFAANNLAQSSCINPKYTVEYIIPKKATFFNPLRNISKKKLMGHFVHRLRPKTQLFPAKRPSCKCTFAQKMAKFATFCRTNSAKKTTLKNLQILCEITQMLTNCWQCSCAKMQVFRTNVR